VAANFHLQMARAACKNYLGATPYLTRTAASSRNTAEPALPGRRCCPLQGGGRSDTKCAKPGG